MAAERGGITRRGSPQRRSPKQLKGPSPSGYNGFGQVHGVRTATLSLPIPNGPFPSGTPSSFGHWALPERGARGFAVIDPDVSVRPTVHLPRSARQPEQLVGVLGADLRPVRLGKPDHVGGAARSVARFAVP